MYTHISARCDTMMLMTASERACCECPASSLARLLRKYLCPESRIRSAVHEASTCERVYMSHVRHI